MTDWNQSHGTAAQPTRRSTSVVSFVTRLSAVLLATAGTHNVESTAGTLLAPAPGPHTLINGNVVGRTELLDWWRNAQVADARSVSFVGSNDALSPWLERVCSNEDGYARGSTSFTLTMSEQSIANNVTMNACVQHIDNAGAGAGIPWIDWKITAVELVSSSSGLVLQDRSNE